MTDFRLLIDGELRSAASRATFSSSDPSTGEVVGRFADAGPEDAEAAVAAARRAFDSSDWATQGRESRLRVVSGFIEGLTARLPELIDMEIRDGGHTSRLANLFTVPLAITHARQVVELYAQRRDVEALPQITTPSLSANHVLREPVGVCTLISAFNFPLLLAAWKVAPALATGCTAILKPSPLAPGTAALLAEVAAEHLPPGVLNVLTSTSVATAEVLTTSEHVDKISFTGSTRTGQVIARAAAGTVKRCTLELGGKGATIFCADADLDVAVPGALWGCFMHQGQACEAGTRLLVPRAIYPEVCDRLVAGVEKLQVGPAADFASDLGPLIDAAAVERTRRYVGLGLDAGARLLTGGQPITTGDCAAGHFFAPTILADVTNDMAVAQDEIFGPVLSVIPYDGGDAAAAAIANDSAYGLACAVWSSDLSRAHDLASRLRCGTVWINDHHLINGYAPFGGYKQSGIGRELGPPAVEEYLETKHVHVDFSPRLDQKYWFGVLGLS